ncbi:MAG: hypothetical protein LBQ98_03785 [Nitrososphaerota archaeon]|jgi:hypothetical protein|nr:hypothetical protein [Nitrososphaerota archaeon]
MPQMQWTHIHTLQKKIRITSIETQKRHVNAIDLEQNIPLCLVADKAIVLTKIKRAKIYQATLKVYETEFTSELEQYLFESAMDDPQRFKVLQALKASGAKPIKYELIALKH